MENLEDMFKDGMPNISLLRGGSLVSPGMEAPRTEGRRWRLPTLPKLNWASEALWENLFIVLLSTCLALRIFWLPTPIGSLIFDEYYYVNSARALLGLPQTAGEGGLVPYPAATPGLDPNREHPPLAKLIIALSIRALGDNAYGWRLPSVAFSVLSVLVFYRLMGKLGASSRLAFLASFLFTFDNLAFVHSRIATLDIYSLAFMLTAFYLYLSGRGALSGLAMALGTLSKESGLLGVLVIALYGLTIWARSGISLGRPSFERLRGLRPLAIFLLSYAAALIGILYILDTLWTTFQSPIDHLLYIYSYAAKLASPRGPMGIESLPWQWLMNEVQIPYLKVDVKVTEDSTVVGSYSTIHFVGAMNPFILFLTIPAIAYQAYTWKRQGGHMPIFLTLWFALTYLPYYPMALVGNRVMYIFYFLNTIPSICGAVASMLHDSGLPKPVLAAYLASVLLGFAALFPFKRMG